MGTLMAGAGMAEIALTQALLPQRENFTRILDPLHVRVVLLQADTSAVIVSLELTSLMGGVDTLRRQVGAWTDTDPDHVWITVSHTFSAPHIQAGTNGPGPRQSPEEQAQSTAQTEALLSAVEAACKQAKASVRPARMGYGTGDCAVNAGRDVETVDGWWLGEGSTAFADKALLAIRLDALDGSPIALLYNYAIQSSVLDHAPMSDSGYVVSADLTGVACALEEKRYPGAVAVFLCGAAGDQAPRQKASSAVLQPDGTLKSVERAEAGIAMKDSLGTELGEAVCAVADTIQADLTDVTVSVHSRRFAVPAKVMPDRSEVYARREIQYEAAGATQTDVDVLRIGPAVLVGVKPELSAATGVQIREGSVFPLTMVVTMVNGGAKYMADQLGCERITYAAQNGPFAPGAAELLRDHALALLCWMEETQV